MGTFFLLQAINGKYAGIENTAWTWFFGQILPGLACLMASSLLALNRGKLLLPWVGHAVLGLSVFYLCWVGIALVGIAGGNADQSLDDSFMQSYRYLFPMQLLLLLTYGILFFKKDPLFQPTERNMQAYAQSLLSENAPATQRAALEYFNADDLPGMLQYMAEKMRAKNPTQIPTEVLMLQNRFVGLQKNQHLGMLSADEIRKERALICNAALGLVTEI